MLQLLACSNMLLASHTKCKLMLCANSKKKKGRRKEGEGETKKKKEKKKRYMLQAWVFAKLVMNGPKKTPKT
jgi:hypothetical protein